MSQTPTLPTHTPAPVARLEVPLTDDQVRAEARPTEEIGQAKSLPTLPCQYVVIRSTSGAPERFQANSDQEAMERLQKEVRAGQTPVVWCYKLMCAEVFVPSSNNLTPEAIQEMVAKQS